MNLDTLNDKQKEAVNITEGPLLVLAGAGSGKTKVLTTKVAKLILDNNVDPSNILAITFTNKAAKEMKERILNMVGPIGYQIQISTFHSFGLSILKKHYDKLKLSKNFTILDSDDSSVLIKNILKDMNCDENYKVMEIPEEIFSVNYIKEFEEMMKKFPVKLLNQVGVDGLSESLSEYINKLSDEEYKVWLDYHFKNCERKDLMGYSSHVLYICEKN